MHELDLKEAITFSWRRFCEAAMLVCFGLSWPMNAYKNYKAGTAVGTSWQFIALITLGYAAGIAAKFAAGTLNWVLAVYFVNVVCIAANWLVYFLQLLPRRPPLLPAARRGRDPRRGIMVLMSTIANINWIIFGGLFTAILVASRRGPLFDITIIGIPLGRQCFERWHR